MKLSYIKQVVFNFLTSTNIFFTGNILINESFKLIREKF